MIRHLLPATLLGPLLLLPADLLHAQAQTRAPAAPSAAATSQANRIVAVVNGDIVTRDEVASRTRLFALNSGIGADSQQLAAMAPQVTRLLIDEKLRLQEIQRRRIPVTDDEIAEAVRDIETRNNLGAGGVVAQLRRAGVEPRVLFDQIRVQLGWSRLIRGLLGPQARPGDAEIEEFIAAYRARTGQTEYQVGEIFIPQDAGGPERDVRGFVDNVVNQLRRGSAFPVTATQFSQSQTAAQGGDLGWVRAEELDPEVARVITQMPVGAISNAIRVPGGFQIVTLRQKRQIGVENATMLSVRQVFLPFTSLLDPNNPTQQQRDTLVRAQAIRGGCDAVEAAARGSPRPADPGPVRLESLPPPLRTAIGGLQPGSNSGPLPTPEGILVVAVCARETRNLAELTPEIARQQIVRDRAELLSRQVQRDLRRRSQIEMRG